MITFEQRACSKLGCGCDVSMKQIIKDNHTNLQISFLMLPELDTSVALQMIETLEPDAINDQIDAFPGFAVVYQLLYHALEVFTSIEIATLLAIKLEHREH